MIFAFGIHKDKARLAGMEKKLEQMIHVRTFANRVPYYYIEDIDYLAYKIAKLEAKIKMVEGE